ncbi:trypsin-like peptidase domain-containing protein [Fimbriiglobus ruber]|uniref:High-affnity carbon uptake protein Hat/HatR n=1 Tax=Fimbriiglobus ruber TaxID=1908690 RepID=A0A225DJX4_9BACT|nr:trypsin-like peptidase domain-containing protein [Fimbriiglobus ruber]OWK37746.1 High-affnity carbon uptake protein Hat/HatR [Fimbriiglobus ruber]
MAISVTCPGCKAVYPVAENMVGKSIKCKKCDDVIPVVAPAAVARPVAAARVAQAVPAKPVAAKLAPTAKDDARPARTARRPRDEDEDAADEDRPRDKAKGKKPAKKGPPIVLILGVAVLFFVVVGGGIAAFFAFGSGDKPTEVVVLPGDENKAFAQAMNQAMAQAGQTPAGPGAATPAAPVATPTVGKKPDPAAAKAEVTPTPAAPKPPASAYKPAVPVARPSVASLPSSPPATNRDAPEPLAMAKCKNAAVYIEVEDNKGGGGSGSGWFGLESGLVFTNAHVLGMKLPGSSKPVKVTIFINPGTPQQREIPNERLEILAVDRDMDLALMRILNESDLPAPLYTRPSRDLRDLEKLVVLGYPGGRRLSAGNKSTKPPAVTVTATNVSSLRQDDNGNLYSVQVQGGIVHGNSGGPIVDMDGNVTAVAVRVDLDRQGRFTTAAYGVPTEYVTGLLAGRVADIEYGQAYRQSGKVHIPVTLNCLDPFERLRSVGIGYWVGDTSNKTRPPGTERTGMEPGDSEFQEAPFAYKFTKDKQTATGELVFPELPPGRAYWAQPFFAAATGEKNWQAGNMVKLPGPPVDREPADLIARYKIGSRRPLTLMNMNTLDEHEQGEGEEKSERLLIGTELKAFEHVEPTTGGSTMAILKIDYDSLKLRLEKGVQSKEDVLPKQLQSQLNNGIKQMHGAGHVDKKGELFQMATIMHKSLMANPLQFAILKAFSDDAMETLQAASIPLPGTRVDPLYSWKSVKTLRFHVPTVTAHPDDADSSDSQVPRPRPPRPGMPRPGNPNPNLNPGVPRPGNSNPDMVMPVQQRATKEYQYKQNMTYVYLGSRIRAGQKEAVIKVDGVITPPDAGASSLTKASGLLHGYAYVDLDTGIVLEADITKEFEIDTSKDGVSKQISAFNTYKLSRGTAQ